MQPESAKLLNDMLEAITRIGHYVADESMDSYLRDGELRDAVQWNFTVIGEALAQLHKLDPTVAQQIREWRRIIAFRNQLIHGYGVIKNEITWDIVQSKLPALREDVLGLLGLPQL